MARTHSRPAAASALPARPPAPPVDPELLASIAAEAEIARSAFAAVMQLLHACDPTHPVCAGNLAALLDPIWASVDQLSGDLATARRNHH